MAGWSVEYAVGGDLVGKRNIETIAGGFCRRSHRVREVVRLEVLGQGAGGIISLLNRISG